MKDDFERLQEQIKRRNEKEQAAKEIAQYYRDEQLQKIEKKNEKNKKAAEKVRVQHRKLEIQSVKNYKKNLIEIEEKQRKD